MTKNVWVQPQTVVQQFVANEYVAACTPGHEVYKFVCDAGNGQKGDVFVNGENLTENSFPIFGRSYFHSCGETHEAPVKDEFVRGTLVLNNGNDQLEYWDPSWGDLGNYTPYPTIEVFVWTAGGTNVHCTTNLDVINQEPTKS